MNFYLAPVDDQMRHPEDRPSIGLILCKEHNRVIVEYALRDAKRPMGVARWELRRSLPEDLKGALSSSEMPSAPALGRRKIPMRSEGSERPSDVKGITVRLRPAEDHRDDARGP